MATATVLPKSRIQGGSWLLEERSGEDIFTPEDFSEQHKLIAQTAEEFAQKEIIPNIEKMEHKDWGVVRELLRKASEIGIATVDVPEEYGGAEMDKISSAIIADRIAVCGSFSTSFGGHAGIGTLPIVYFGNEQQKKKYLPKLTSGEWIGAYALSESTSGSDALNARCKATLAPDGKQYLLNGEKMWITNAGFADLYVVFAKIDGEKFTAFLVERTFPGFAVGAEEKKMGIRGSSTCPLILSDCQVPVEYAVECSIIKVWASEMLDRVVDDNVQIYGGYGFVEEYPAERAYRDSRVNRIFEGTNEINRMITTGWLLKQAMSGKLPLMAAIKN